jgi:hypothetical protein
MWCLNCLADLTEIQFDLCQHFQSISSIEFESEFVDNFILVGNVNDAKSKQENIGEIKYAQKGDFFRVESILKNKKNEGIDSNILTFDGHRYQRFSKELESMDIKKTPLTDNPVRFLNPIFVPYMWLFEISRAGDDNVSNNLYFDLRARKIWELCFKNGKLIEENVYQGKKVSIGNFSNEKVGTDVQVYFAIDLGYMPIKIISTNKEGTERGDISVIDYCGIQQDGQMYYFPTQILVQSSSPTHVYNSKMTVRNGSIKINHDIPSDFFSISESKAKTVVDVDALELVIPEEKFSTKVSRVVLIVLGLAMIIMFFVIRFITRGSQKKSE